MTEQHLVVEIVKFLRQSITNMSPEHQESLEVAIQCLESAYDVNSHTFPESEIGLLTMFQETMKVENELSEAHKQEAEALKNKGNSLMKEDGYVEAIQAYSKAISLNNQNAVFYCNRAAAFSKLNQQENAIRDCKEALRIDPTYSKAHGRLGLAYSSLEKHVEAAKSYQQALDLEPDNESYRNNLSLAQEKIANPTDPSMRPGPALPSSITSFDLGSVLNNTALMSMASQMLSDPAMQNMVSEIFSGNRVQRPAGMDALIEAGQQLAQQMQNVNPDLVQNLRQSMGPGGEHNPPNPEDPHNDDQNTH